MNIIKYNVPQADINYSLPSIFLAGPTVRGNQPHLTSWRREAEMHFTVKGFEGNLIVPEFPDPAESDQVRYDLPVWEFEGLTKSHVILFWIPRTRGLIGLTTNYELGFWTAHDRHKIVYGRPKDAYRVTYLDIMWIEHYKQHYHGSVGEPVAIHTTLPKAINAVLKNERLTNKGNRLQEGKNHLLGTS